MDEPTLLLRQRQAIHSLRQRRRPAGGISKKTGGSATGRSGMVQFRDGAGAPPDVTLHLFSQARRSAVVLLFFLLWQYAG